ncbi:Smr/MutS family protein [Roseibium litorale]|uniref:Smr/MutS family protein n=1 Tax=Roseibium litorale TaxID=2803841 RepID=A0ABR9CKX1_9HYPH|nr:Smr/MutS family protein [Roseibium litorale]MBD8891502.1 Smr/MutS family protein [Roseibium litorale]
MKAKRRKKGQLSEEDRTLWAKVTSTLAPLHSGRVSKPDPLSFEEVMGPEAGDAGRETARVEAPQTAMREPVQAPRPPSPPPLHQMEYKYRKKVVRGVRPIDARIDLHGLTQHQAHDRLRHFLYGAQAHGHKVVLVITGKGGTASAGHGHWDERGVLRRVVPQWLAMPDLRQLVIGYEEAHVTHGGSGALYVRIRRRR